jgi:hypothetical protein
VEPVTAAAVQTFLRRLGERYPGSGALYLLGGSALLLLGSPRETLDVDYTVELAAEFEAEFHSALAALAAESKLDLELVELAEFIPLPPQANERRRLVGRYGQLEVYIYDLYSIALSKIARGFESDLEDVLFMLGQRLIEFDELERLFNSILPDAPKADISRAEFSAYFNEVRRRTQS